ncbi:MAG: glycoside hydrolase family 88 protein [Pseudomonadota bacterium]
MTVDDPADTGESYATLALYQPPTAHKALFSQALDRALAKIGQLVPVFGLRNPRMGLAGTYIYEFCTEDEWVASFWSGQLWLAYSLTGDERLKNSARARRSYFQRILENPAWHDHDLGFLYSLSCVADYKLTGDEKSRAMALRAADFLAARWRQPMPFVMCWNPMRRDTPEFAARKTRTMNIDSLQGMALLYWAYRETGQNSFADIANMHNETAMAYLVRENHSSYHAYEFDAATGKPVRGFTHQGMGDESCWSRGQAWAIHGFAQSYLNTGNVHFRDTAARMADYIADKLPEDGIPLWDYDLSADHQPYRDTSAAAITAAGLYTIAKGFGPGREAARYTALADRILSGLVEHADISGIVASQGLLKEGAAFVGLGCADNLLPYGDYYYLEALMRAMGHTEFFW